MRRQRILVALDDYLAKHGQRDRGPARRNEARAAAEELRDGRGTDWSAHRWRDAALSMLQDCIARGGDPVRARELVRKLLGYIAAQYRRFEEECWAYAEFKRDHLPRWLPGDAPTRLERTCLLLDRLAREGGER